MAATDRIVRSDTPPPSAGTTLSRRMLLGLVLLAFVAGAIATGWLLSRSGWSSGDPSSAPEMAALAEAPPPATPALARLADSVDPVTGNARPLTAPSPSGTPPLAGSLGPVSEQVDTLEARLASIRAAVDHAESNGRRAEAMLLAVAARRTLDRGVPLGFLQAQLRARFPGQPRAVDTIVQTAARPVTVESLRAGLPDLDLVRSGGRLLTLVRGEGPPLLSFRRSGTPIRDPAKRLDDADQALGRGDVAAAVDQVSAMRSTPERQRWLDAARRYLDARQALDVIETAAILQGSGETTPQS